MGNACRDRNYAVYICVHPCEKSISALGSSYDCIVASVLDTGRTLADCDIGINYYGHCALSITLFVTRKIELALALCSSMYFVSEMIINQSHIITVLA